MSIPLERIVALIEATPGVRLVELADEMNEDESAIERALAPALADGSILAVNLPIFGGKLMASYSLKTSPTISAAPAPAPAATPAPRPAAEVAVPSEPEPHAQVKAEPQKMRGARRAAEPVARRERVPVDSMADRALDFIKSQPGRRASNALLRRHLAIPKGKYPSNYFRRFIEEGTLVRVRNGWAATPLDVGGRAHDGIREVVTHVGEGAAAALNEPHELRYALWSDGMLELRRGATTVALLTVAERIALRAFLAVGSPV
jgi:hypothetical protein